MEGVLARDVEQLIPAGPLTKQPEREREREEEVYRDMYKKIRGRNNAKTKQYYRCRGLHCM
jgi:hypothetical protein